jgi:hypothetical protein
MPTSTTGNHFEVGLVTVVSKPCTHTRVTGPSKLRQEITVSVTYELTHLVDPMLLELNALC